MLLPTPSPRNLEIYNHVRHRGRSLRDAADEFNLSATRISEICAQVERWYAATMPEWAAHLNRESAALAAWRTHQQRLEQFYADVLEAWQLTKTDITKRAVPGFGDPRCLLLALRLSLQQCAAATAIAKLPAEWFAKVASDPLPDEIAAPTEPPTGVCATEPTLPAAPPQPPAPSPNVTRDPTDISKQPASLSSPPPPPSHPLPPPVRRTDNHRPDRVSHSPTHNRQQLVADLSRAFAAG
jgi:hypothetical protein